MDISGREKHDSFAAFCSLDSKTDSPYGYTFSGSHRNSRPIESCQVKPERNRNPLAGNLRFPVDNGCLSSPFGYRKGVFHGGLDITAESGEPIRACADGEVIFAGTVSKYRNYGKMVLVDHGDGVLTRYAHASKVLVAPGKKVKMGDRIALVGRSGKATAPHLHLEIEVRGKLYNPLACFSDDQLQLVRVASRFPMPPLGQVSSVSIFHKHLASLSIR
jgi:murein DD-endopeptidase MepM/ murein hydrolase activator NlpD